MIKVDLLESVIVVVETGNMSQAAIKLNRTQSALSLKIKRLEETVNNTLLERTNKGVRPTQLGEEFLVYARRLVNLNKQTLNFINGQQQERNLKLGIPTNYIEWYLKNGILDFIKTMANVRVQIFSDVSDNLQQRLANGEFDAIIMTGPRSAHSDDILIEREFVWVSPLGEPYRQADKYPLALFPEGCPSRRFALSNNHQNKAFVSLSTSCPSAIAIAVEQGAALAVMSRFRVTERMVVIDPKDYGLPLLPPVCEVLLSNHDADSGLTETLSELIRTKIALLS